MTTCPEADAGAHSNGKGDAGALGPPDTGSCREGARVACYKLLLLAERLLG
jgi:hypothetical protein